MLKELKKFWQEEDGMGVVEIILIIAALVGLALLFKNTIFDFVKKILGDTVNQGDVTPSDEQKNSIYTGGGPEPTPDPN